jgi:PAS domain S-box-containing protein
MGPRLAYAPGMGVGEETQTTTARAEQIRLGRPFLVVLQAPAQTDIGRIIQIADQMSIGRSSEAHISIRDGGLSRRHVELTRNAESCAIRDLGSRNGTRVNNVPVKAIDLEPGDQIQIGATLLLFQSGVGSYHPPSATKSVALWKYDATGDHLEFSEQVDVALELPPSTLGRKPRPVDACIHEADRDRFRAAIATAGEDGFAIELRLTLSPSLERWVMLRAADRVPGGSIVDITGLKRREATLARSASMFESFLDGVALVDHAGTIVDVNNAMARIAAKTRVELIGRNSYVDILGDKSPDERARQIEDAIDQTERWTTTLAIRNRPDRSFELLVFPLRTELGERAGAAWVFRDVTEKRRLEAQVALLDRLASLGTLSAGIAHEINNPLAFILTNAEHVRDNLAADQHLLAEVMTDVIDGAQRIAGIVHDLQTFSRVEGSPSPVPVDVGHAVVLALKMTGPVLRSRARVVTELESVGCVAAVEPRLVQVLINLLINAAEAIPDDTTGATITIATRRRDGGVEIAVSDTGIGMTPEIADRAFEPFFTTKPMTGTGLGLSICHGLVTDMGGKISVVSTGGVTRATVWLRSMDCPAPRDTPRRLTQTTTRKLRILIVDDEAAVLRAFSRMLSGHDLATAGGFEEAARRLFDAREAYDVVLCDLMMPDGSGMELHARVVAERPELAPKMIFVTGGAFTESAEVFLRDTKNPCLIKPVTGETLRRAVEQHAK